MRSVRTNLLALVLICITLASCAFGVLLWRANELSRAQTSRQAGETAQALSLAVDGQLERALGVLSALRASEAAQRRDWRGLDRQARVALQDENAWILVQDRTGQQLVNTRIASGATLPRGPAPADMWRDLDAARIRVCDLSHGYLEKNIVCVDQGLNSEGPIEEAISVMFRPALFQSIVAREGVQEGQLATLVDRQGVVIWRNLRPDKYVGRTAFGPLLNELKRGSRDGTLETKSLDGVPMLTSYHRSPLSGWTVVVGVPRAKVGALTRNTLLWGSLAALAVLALSCLLAALLIRRIMNGLRILGHAVEQGAESRRKQSTGLSEFDEAADALHDASRARAEAQRHQEMLIGELNHRVKNSLAVVQSLARQTFRGRTAPEESIAAFEARLQTLAAAHNILTRQRWESASLREIARAALAPFCAPKRCRIVGPDIEIPAQLAVSFALAFHELATNALKYGALSVPDGSIALSWSEDDGAFRLTWQERGGPRVEAPSSSGFGTRLVKRALAAELGGTVELDFAPDGLRCVAEGVIPKARSNQVLERIS